jgi:hypothetical protein
VLTVTFSAPFPTRSYYPIIFQYTADFNAASVLSPGHFESYSSVQTKRRVTVTRSQCCQILRLNRDHASAPSSCSLAYQASHNQLFLRRYKICDRLSQPGSRDTQVQICVCTVNNTLRYVTLRCRDSSEVLSSFVLLISFASPAVS